VWSWAAGDVNSLWGRLQVPAAGTQRTPPWRACGRGVSTAAERQLSACWAAPGVPLLQLHHLESGRSGAECVSRAAAAMPAMN